MVRFFSDTVLSSLKLRRSTTAFAAVVATCIGLSQFVPIGDILTHPLETRFSRAGLLDIAVALVGRKDRGPVLVSVCWTRVARAPRLLVDRTHRRPLPWPQRNSSLTFRHPARWNSPSGPRVNTRACRS